MTTSLDATNKKPKDSKKDRHMRNLYELSQFLERVNEKTVQEVLLLKRVNRETLETLDEELDNFCKRIDVDTFLLDKSEDDLLRLLDELKAKIDHRSQIIQKYGDDLDNTEVKRSSEVATELKNLVDRLVAIAHQLPDDIERLVANEAFDINKEVINNRMTHTKTLGDLKINHIQLEDVLIERWEATRRKWRQLRHDKAMTIYTDEIRNDFYNDPADRRNFMKKFRDGQLQRRKDVENQLKTLLLLHYATINSETIQDIKNNFTKCNENELIAIQNCYDSLTQFRGVADYNAKERVESLRKELHVYGALKVDPKLHLLAPKLETALADESLAELWRLGGGLKPDVQTLISESCCEEIVYDRVVNSMSEKLQLIISGFPLKAVLVEKGRQSQLDKIRNLITKMRSAPRVEIPAVLAGVLKEAEEIANMDQLPELFRETVLTICTEMKEELANYETKVQQQQQLSLGGTGAIAGTALLNASSIIPNDQTRGILKSAGGMGTAQAGTMKTSNKTSFGKSKKGGADKDGNNATVCVDPIQIKNWYRKLALLFYASDLPEEYQQHLQHSIEQVEIQRECNKLVDEVVLANSEAQLRKMDLRYKRVIDRITTFLENQANYVFIQTSNLGHFFSRIAKMLEFHRSEQKRLDDKSADELWDLKEESRFQLEDLEAEYEAACQKIREATKQEEINTYFDEVLSILDRIQTAYRTYHKDACFTSDRYPVYLINEYREFIIKLAKILFMQPKGKHGVLTEYERLFDQVTRFNRSYFEANTNAMGFPRIPPISDSELPTNCQEFNTGQGEGVSDQHTAYSGVFGLFINEEAIWPCFAAESYFEEKKDKNNTEPADDQSVTDDAEAQVAEDAMKARLLAAGTTAVPHSEYPFMKSEAPQLPLPAETVAAMDELEKEEYDTNLLKGFVELLQPAPVVEAVPAKGGKGAPAKKAPAKGKAGKEAEVEGPPPLDPELQALLLPGGYTPSMVYPNFQTTEQLSPEQLKTYLTAKLYADNVKNQRAIESNIDYIRQNIPCSKDDQPWVEVVEVTNKELASLYVNLRKNFISNVEIESFKKVLSVEKRMDVTKKDFTDQLEERIRQHWPRRGRVETEIKQPREAELLGHKDKTWRLIQTIQSKMIELQKRFIDFCQDSKKSCDDYVSEMIALRNSVNGEFKNLASLQGIDVKARSTTISFQTDCMKRVQYLQQLNSSDVDNVINYARDFRKICPLQKPGVEGGYSEAEIDEIQVLVNNQCQEIGEVAMTWEEDIKNLEELQEQSLKCQDEFTDKYNKCVQQVAMAEGLGQKYGAPRRRAQERIRTEVARDERQAGKVDAILAEAEFLCEEGKYHLKRAKEFSDDDNHSTASALHQGKTSQLKHGETKTLASTSSKSLSPSRTTSNNNKTAMGKLLRSNTSSSMPLSKNQEEDLTSDHDLVSNIHDSNDLPAIERGAYRLMQLQRLWLLVRAVRISLYRRGKFLDVLLIDLVKSMEQDPAYQFSWVDQPRLNDILNNFQVLTSNNPFTIDEQEELKKLIEDDQQGLVTQGQLFNTLVDVYEDVNKQCRTETRELYDSEGLLETLNNNPTGIPESLEAWLHEAKDKLLGKDGYRERAWKRLWDQLNRLDNIYGRLRALAEVSELNQTLLNDDHQHTSNAPLNSSMVGFKNTNSMMPQTITSSNTTYNNLLLQTVCIRFWTLACMDFAKHDWKCKATTFVSALNIWEKSREKHERLLKPKLGSPEMAGELAELEQMETARSHDIVDNVQKFRSSIVRSQFIAFRQFLEDLTQCTRGLLQMLDATLRQELLQVPPDVEQPKKHLTLKKLRKAQRIKQQVAQGLEDTSQKREWPPLKLQGINGILEEILPVAESLVVDLGQDTLDTSGGGGNAIQQASAPPPEVTTDKKGKDAKKADKKGANEPPPVTSPPSLLPIAWQEKLTQISKFSGLVSPSHRVIINERDDALKQYIQFIKSFVEEVRDHYNLILTQEKSWTERWNRQVAMLRAGNV